MPGTKKRRAKSQYGNLPEELQQLIEHTDRGVKRLYRTAAADASLDTSQRETRPHRRSDLLIRPSAPARAARQSRRGPWGPQRLRRWETENDEDTEDEDDDESIVDDSDGGEEEEVPARNASFYSSETQEGGREARNAPRLGKRHELLSARTAKAQRQLHGDADESAFSTSFHLRHDPQPSRVPAGQHRRKKPLSNASSSVEGSAAQRRRDRSIGKSGPPNASHTEDSASLIDRSAASGTATPGQRQRATTATSSSMAHTARPALSTPSAGTQSLFLSPDRSGLSNGNDSTTLGRHGGGGATAAAAANMQTGFGRKWSQTFQALFGSGTADMSGRPTSTSTTPPRQQQQQQQQQHSPVKQPAGPALANNPLCQPASPPSLSSSSQPQPNAPAGDDGVSASISNPSGGDRGEERESAQLNGLLVLRLREELRERDQEMMKLRLDHALEVATLKDKMAEAVHEATAAATRQAAEAAEVKLEVVRASLQVEQQRLADVRAEMEEMRHAKFELEEKLRGAEGEAAKYAAAAQELKTCQDTCDGLRAACAEREDAYASVKRELEAQRHEGSKQASALEAAEEQARDLEKRLLAQEETARDTLRSLEQEFTATTDSYQQLLTEATKRMGSLEKVRRKYRMLKETARRLEEDAAAAKAQHDEMASEWVAERARLSEELQAAKEEAETLRNSMRELSATHDAALEELRRQSEAQKLSATGQAQLLHTQLDTANHTIQLLRTQVESLKADVAEEQAHSQEIIGRMAETELRLQEEKQGQQRAAGSYRAQTEETLAALRRQLKEKDAKLKALAASQAEPLQRIRSQLEQERGRRALLEEQFAQYKRRAKEAEEAALLEMRREKLRNATALLTPQSTPAPPSTTTHAGGASRQPWAVSGTSAAYSSSPRGSHATITPKKPWHSSANTSGRSSSQVQPKVRLTDEAHSPPQIHTTKIAEEPASVPVVSQPRAAPPPQAVTESAAPQDGPQANWKSKNSGGTPQPPPSVQLFEKPTDTSQHSGAGTGTPPVRGVDSISGITLNSPCKSVSDAALEAATATPTTTVTATGKDATKGLWRRGQSSVESADKDYGPGAAATAALALLGRGASASAAIPLLASPPPAPALVLNEDARADGAHPDTRERRPWYQYTPAIPTSRQREGKGGGALLLSPPPSHCPASSSTALHEAGERQDTEQLRAQNDSIIAEQQRESALSDDHERRMQEYHASAAHIFHKITASRDELMAQCAAIVRQSTAARRRQQGSRPDAPLGTADSVSLTSDEGTESSGDS